MDYILVLFSSETMKGRNLRHWIKQLEWVTRLAFHTRVSFRFFRCFHFFSVYVCTRLFHYLTRFLSLVEAIAPIQSMILILLPNSKSGLSKLSKGTWMFANMFVDSDFSPEKITFGRTKERWIQREEAMVLLNMEIMFLFLVVPVNSKFSGDKFGFRWHFSYWTKKSSPKSQYCRNHPSTTSILSPISLVNAF